MKNERVAILDIRSYGITFLIGSKGVNGTFVFCGAASEKYEGYTSEGFLDEVSFRGAVKRAVASVLKNYDGKISSAYVGVPATFTKIYAKGQTISFPSRRKITSEEITSLYAAGKGDIEGVGGRLVRYSDMYFSIGDNRKYFCEGDILGAKASLLQGALCYYYADGKFCEIVEDIFKELKIEEINYIPQTYAQSMYLISEQSREGYAFFLDVGFLTTSVSVIYGNGIVHEASFDTGEGTILLSLMENLHVEYEKAEEILLNADISGGVVQKDAMYTDANGEEYSLNLINETIKCGLDEICEKTDGFFSKYYSDKSLLSKAGTSSILFGTGEGLGNIRGSAEHISRRLNRLTEVAKPDIPYYDKPIYSSLIALLWAATEDDLKKSSKEKLFRFLFGGRKK